MKRYFQRGGGGIFKEVERYFQRSGGRGIFKEVEEVFSKTWRGIFKEVKGDYSYLKGGGEA